MTLRHSILQALTEALTNIGILHVDVWNHNVEFIDQEQAWHRPAVFVEFGDMQWQYVKEGHRRTRFQLMLHLVCDYTEHGDMESQWELSDTVISAIRGISTEDFDISTVESTQTNHNHEDLIEEVLTFNVRAMVEENRQETPPDPLVEDPNTTHRQILDKMSREMPQLREALSALFCPRWQHLSNESIRTSDNPMIMDLSGHNRHLVMVNFEGTAESGVDADGNVHFNGIDNYAYYMPINTQDTEGMGDLANRGYCVFVDRTYEIDPYDGTQILYSFGDSRPMSGTSAAALNTSIYMGGNTARNNASNAYYYIYGTTVPTIPSGNAYDGVSYFNVKPNIAFNSSTNVAVEYEADGYRATASFKGTPTYVAKGFFFGGLRYNAGAVVQPFKGTFRGVAWFNRCLTDEEIEWVKTNMKWSQRQTVSPMMMMMSAPMVADEVGDEGSEGIL